MKFLNIIVLLGIFCFTCLLVSAQEEPPKRGILLRRPPTGGRAGLNHKATTTTAAPKNEENFDDEYTDNAEEHSDNEKLEGENVKPEEPSTTTTSTEPPKKIGPIIRPFRSNDDLLLALKRRQMSAKKGHQKVEKVDTKHHDDENHEESHDSAPDVPAVKISKSTDRSARRNKFTKTAKPAAVAPSVDPVEASADESQPSSAILGHKRPARLNLKTLRSNN